jgi:hypothetical protein
MPYPWNNKIAVTKDDLVPGFFPSWDALEKKLYRDAKRPVGIRRIQRGGGLNCEVLIDYDTLPRPIREKLPDPRHVDCVLEKFFSVDGEAVRYYAEKRVGKHGYIAPERQTEYVLDASVLRAAILLRAAHIHEVSLMRGKTKSISKFLSAEVNLLNELRKLKNLPCHTLPTNRIRFTEKLKRFEESGYDTLLKGYDNQNAILKTKNEDDLLNAMYIQKHKPTYTEVFKQYDAFLRGEVEVINPTTGELYNPSPYNKLSRSTVTRFLASWEQRVATHLKRSADRQVYMAKNEPFQTLQHPRYAGSSLSIDDRQAPFAYDRDGHRVWFYMGIDLGSECFIGFVWGKDKNAGLLQEFYREVVRNCTEWGVNVPAQLECESHLNSTLKDTLLQEGNMFEYVSIYPNSAHSKRIERYFAALRYILEKAMPGWIGRPHARSEANQTNSDKREIIPFDAIVERCLKEIENWNNSPCTIYPDKTRYEVFLEKQHPEVKPTNWHGILPYIGEWTSTSCNHGQIKLNGKWFVLGDKGSIYTGKDLLALMKMVEGKSVDICWLRGHNGQALKALVYVDNRCACEAIPQPVAFRSKLEARSDPQAVANMELMERYKNTIRAYARSHKNEIENLVIIDNRKNTLNDKFKIGWINEEPPIYIDKNEDDDGSPIIVGESDPFSWDLNSVETYSVPTLMERFAGK